MSRIASLSILASVAAVLVAMPAAASSSAEGLGPLRLDASVLRDAAAASARSADDATDVAVDRGPADGNTRTAAAFDALRPTCREGLQVALALAAVAACAKTGCGSPDDVPRNVIPTYDQATRSVPRTASCTPKKIRLW